MSILGLKQCKLEMLIWGQETRRMSLSSMSHLTIKTILQWKTTEERNTQTSFVQQRGPKRRVGEECTYYYCNRHGDYRPKGNGICAMKSQGTCKIGEQCTAYMKVTTSMISGKVSVEYCTNHNHEIAIAHLHIPQDTRVSIAAELQNGVNIDKVLDHVRENVSDTLGRQHLISKQDIRNIEKQFNVDGIKKHTSDSECTCMGTRTSKW